MTTPSPAFADLIGTNEAAYILDRDRVTVMRWAKAGRLGMTHRVGRRGLWLFDRSAVESLARELSTPAGVEVLPIDVTA